MENILISTRKGHNLNAYLFTPSIEHKIKKLILFGSATGIQCTYYAKLANYLAENGYFVLLYDYTGIGGSLSTSIRKIDVKMEDWGFNDLQSVVDWIVNQKEYEHLYYVGHSIGGQIIGFLKDPNVFEKLIFIASQNGYWRYYTKRKYVYAVLYYTLWPLLIKIFGYLPSKRLIGENLPKGVAKQWVSWLKSENYLFDHLHLEGFNQLTRPILAYTFTDDHYAPPKATENLLSHYPNAQIELNAISPAEVNKKKIGHFGFFKEQNKEIFWSEIIKYFKTI